MYGPALTSRDAVEAIARHIRRFEAAGLSHDAAVLATAVIVEFTPNQPELVSSSQRA